MKPNLRRILVAAGFAALALGLMSVISGRLRPPSSPASFVQGTQVVSEGGRSTVAAGGPSRQTSVPEARKAQQDERLSYSTEWLNDSGESAVDGFRRWTGRYLAARSLEARQSLAREGVELATARRALMESLIRSDPRVALALAVPAALYDELPPEVVDLLEERVSGSGELTVRHVDWIEGDRFRAETVRAVTLGEARYRAHVYGRRLGQSSTDRAYVHGIAIGRELALHESPVRLLEPGEHASAAITVAAIDSAPTGDEPLNAAIGSAIVRFAGRAALLAAEERLNQIEALVYPGPERSLALLLDPEQSMERGLTENSRSLGPKRALLVRVDFPDLPGEPQNFGGQVCTPEYLQSVNEDQIAPMYAEASFGRTSLEFVVAPKVYRAPQNTAVYSEDAQLSGADALKDDVHALVSADYDLTTFDHVAMVFSSLSGYPAGMAGGRDLWISGSYRFSVVAHEIGHNYGWGHANLWVGSSSPIDTDGWSAEYYDGFDVMGWGSFPDSFGFGVATMYTWGWLTAEQTATATADGTYRLYASDQKGLSLAGGRLLGVKVRQGDSGDYWISFRSPVAEGYGAYPAGAHVARLQTNYRQTEMVSLNNSDDVIYYDLTRDRVLLPVGASVTDPAAGVSVTVLAHGGSGRDQYIDVAIAFAPTPVTPEVGLQPADQLNVRSGASAMFSTWARAGQPDVTYLWQRKVGGAGPWVDLVDDGVFAGTDRSVLVIQATDLTMDHDQFRCVMQNTVASAASDAANLTVVEVTAGSYTLAGRLGQSGLVDGPGAVAQFAYPMGLGFAADGSVYVADARNNRMRRITPNGSVTTLAMDVTGPRSVCVDASGNVFVADANASVIRRFSLAGETSVYAGQLWTPGSADGSRESARFRRPTGLAIDSAGNLYVADAADHTVRKIAVDGNVSTLAGAAGEAGYRDGIGSEARFHFMDGRNCGLAVAADGAIYVADSENHCIRRIDLDGVVTTAAGSPERAGSVDGLPPLASLNTPVAVTVGANGVIYIADQADSVIRALSPDGELSTIGGGYGSSEGGGFAMGLKSPGDLAIGVDGRLYIADSNNSAIRVYLPTAPTVTRQPADAEAAPVGGRALFSVQVTGAWPLPEFRWQERRGSSADSAWADLLDDFRFSGVNSSQLFVTGITAELSGREYRCVITNATGETTSRAAALRVAASGVFVLAGSPGRDGARESIANDSGVSAPGHLLLRADGSLLFFDGNAPRVLTPSGLLFRPGVATYANRMGYATDDSGIIYYTDRNQHAVKRLLPDGHSELIAGADQYGGSGSADGVGPAARFYCPSHIVRATDGTLYVYDANNWTLRSIAPDGQVRTVAGVAGQGGVMDGTGPDARLESVTAMVMRGDGNLLLLDGGGQLLRQVTPAGVVTTLAGTRSLNASVDGHGTDARFHAAGGLAVATDGTIYVTERDTNRVRTFSPAGYVGTLRASDGTPVTFEGPLGIAVDGAGTLYVAEMTRHTISGYSLAADLLLPPQIVRGPQSAEVASGSTLTLLVETSGSPTLLFQWFKDGRILAAETLAELDIPSLGSSLAGEYTVLVRNRAGYVISAPAVVTRAFPPQISQPLAAAVVVAGESTSFTITTTGTPVPTFQWYKDGLALTDDDRIAGATTATLTIANTTTADAGSYSVIVTNSAGTVSSSAGELTVLSSRLVNISSRAAGGTGNNVAIGGFVIAGSAPKRLLLRAVGPTLITQGLGEHEVMLDPMVNVYDARKDNAVIAQIDNWGDNADPEEVTSLAARLGATALAGTDANSAAVVLTLDPGVYTFIARGQNDATGIVLVEAYDADVTNAAARLMNISTRAYCTTGNGVSIGGFVVSGNAPKRVLLRALGPTLATQGLGVEEVLQDPQISVHDARNANAVIATNDNWGENVNSATVLSEGARLGATPLAANDTTSSALLLTLKPGVYTFIASGKSSSSGIVLIEVYDAD